MGRRLVVLALLLSTMLMSCTTFSAGTNFIKNENYQMSTGKISIVDSETKESIFEYTGEYKINYVHLYQDYMIISISLKVKRPDSKISTIEIIGKNLRIINNENVYVGGLNG